MDAKAILTVSATVVSLTQLLKMLLSVQSEGVRAAIVFGCSLIGVAFWGWSTGDFCRTTAFGYLAGFITVATSAAGVFGLVVSGQRIANARSQQP